MVALKGKHGQGIVEFAIVLPLLILLLVGFMHMTMVLHDYMAMGEATREAARYAVVGKPVEEIRDKLNVGLTGFYKCDIKNSSDFEIKDSTKNELPPDQELGDYVMVTATMRFDESHGVILTRPFMPDEISTTLTMRKE